MLNCERYRLIFGGCVYKGTETNVGKQGVVLFELFERRKRSLPHSLVAVSCIFTVAPRVPKEVLPVLYEQ